MHPLDTYRAARLLLDQRGDAAAYDYAADRIREMLLAGDNAGVSAWQAIVHAMGELQRTEPKEGERWQ